MNQQVSNLPRTAAILGRYRTLIRFLAFLGLLGGAVFAWLTPPQEATSQGQALVVFSVPSCPEGAICGGPAFAPAYTKTEWIKVPGGVVMKPLTWSVLSITADGAAALNAAAQGYIAYADSSSSMGYMGQRPVARIIGTEGMTTVTGTTSPKRLLDEALLGALFAALVGILAALAGSRTTIDPPAAPPGLDFDSVPDFGTARDFATGPEFNMTSRSSAGFGETGRKEAYGLRGVPLAQLAREYAERMAAAESE
jgi:hypothetical protein